MLRLETNESLPDAIKRLSAMGWIVPPVGSLVMGADKGGKYIICRSDDNKTKSEAKVADDEKGE